jgi:hypothetical protein
MHGGVSSIDEWRILQYNKSSVVTAITKHSEVSPVKELHLYYRSGFTEPHSAQRRKPKATILVVVGVRGTPEYEAAYNKPTKNNARRDLRHQQQEPARTGRRCRGS